MTLRMHRLERGLKQTTLASLAGLTQQTVSNLENGGWMTGEAAGKLSAPLEADEFSLRTSHNLFWLERRREAGHRTPRRALVEATRLLTMIEDWDLPLEETRLVAEVYEELLRAASLSRSVSR